MYTVFTIVNTRQDTLTPLSLITTLQGTVVMPILQSKEQKSSEAKYLLLSLFTYLIHCLYIFCHRFMDNLQTEVLEIEFLSYSNGMNTISEEDFAHILLRYTNVENTSVFLENVRYSIPEEKVSDPHFYFVKSMLLACNSIGL